MTTLMQWQSDRAGEASASSGELASLEESMGQLISAAETMRDL